MCPRRRPDRCKQYTFTSCSENVSDTEVPFIALEVEAVYIQEFDTPANLYAKPDGIFRRMCEQSAITQDDVKLAEQRSVNTDTLGDIKLVGKAPPVDADPPDRCVFTGFDEDVELQTFRVFMV